MVVLRVIPRKVATEVFLGLDVIEELPGIFRGAFDGAEGRFDERIVIGGAGASKQLGHAVIFTQPPIYVILVFIFQTKMKDGAVLVALFYLNM